MYPKKIILLFALLLSSMSHLALAEETSESEGTHTYITEYEGPVCGTIELEDDEQLCEHPGEDNGCFRGTFIDIEDEENEYFWVCDHNYQNVLCSAPKDDCDNEIKAEVNLSYDCGDDKIEVQVNKARDEDGNIIEDSYERAELFDVVIIQNRGRPKEDERPVVHINENGEGESELEYFLSGDPDYVYSGRQMSFDVDVTYDGEPVDEIQGNTPLENVWVDDRCRADRLQIHLHYVWDTDSIVIDLTEPEEEDNENEEDSTDDSDSGSDSDSGTAFRYPKRVIRAYGGESSDGGENAASEDEENEYEIIVRQRDPNGDDMIEMEPVVFIDNRAEIEIDHCDPDHPNYLIPTDTGYLDALLTKNGENVEEFDGNLPMNTRIGGVCEDDPIELIYSCGDETMFVGVKPSTYATLEEELGSSFDPEMLYVSVIQQNPENDTKIMGPRRTETNDYYPDSRIASFVMDYQDPVWNGHNMSFTANLMYGQSESHILNTIDRHDVHVDEVCSEDSGLPKCSSFPLICAQPSPGAGCENGTFEDAPNGVDPDGNPVFNWICKTQGDGSIELPEYGEVFYSDGYYITTCSAGYEPSCDENEYCSDPEASNYLEPESCENEPEDEYDDEYGCTNQNAINFDRTATIDDGSCYFDYDVFGCINEFAINYNPNATYDDGSCYFDYDELGCTDPTATNFDPTATYDDGTCEYVDDEYGCTNQNAINFDRTATIDDGSCYFDYDVFGCINEFAINYNPNATYDDGSCYFDYDELGCTDPTATNFDPTATYDDGSCEYSHVYGCTDSRANNFNPAATYDDGSCEYDDYYGCTDPVATNFDPNALVNDGSCEYPDNYGCTDPTATNFDPNALINDGSCEYNHVYGCTDPKANNFDPNATYDDGSCEYDEEFPKCGHFPKPLCAEPGKNAACAKGKWVDVPDDKDANGNTTKFIWACTTGAVENEDDNENDYPAHVSQNYEDYEQDNSDTEGYSILCEADVDKNCINRPEDFRMNMVHECSDPSIEMKITQLKTISDPTVLTLNLSIEEIDMRNAVVNTMTIPLANQPKFNADGEAIFGLEYIDTTKFNYVTGPNKRNISLSVKHPTKGTLIITDGNGTKANHIGINGVLMDELCTSGPPTNIYGCTDPAATNHNPIARINDGSCEYPDYYGCTDPTATNFDPNARVNDGSCEYNHIYGCTDQLATNYNPNATYDDGSCQYDKVLPKCQQYTQPICVAPKNRKEACVVGNWTRQPDELDPNGKPIKFVWVCSTNNQGNNPNGNEHHGVPYQSYGYGNPYIDDDLDVEGFSILCKADIKKDCKPKPKNLKMEVLYTCGDKDIVFKTIGNNNPDPLAIDLTLDIQQLDKKGVFVKHVGIPAQPKFNARGIAKFPVQYGDPNQLNKVGGMNHYDIIVSAKHNGSVQMIEDKAGVVGPSIGILPALMDPVCINPPIIKKPGCTDHRASNFNPLANLNDGSCQYPPVINIPDIYGCTDPVAPNYDPFALIDDDSCLYPDSWAQIRGGTSVGGLNASCGDGKLKRGEQCDDGNKNNFDGCTSVCTWEFDNECLDHDGTLENNCVEELKTLSTLLTPSQFAELPDDVDPNKLVTIGYLPVCGDGVVWREQDAREMCDDGNTINGDGCNSRCQIEDLFSAGGSLASDTISGQPLGLGRGANVVGVPGGSHRSATGLNIVDDPVSAIKLFLKFIIILALGLILFFILLMKLKERKLYIVKKGDTLASIAADHATTQRKLRVMNKKDRHWQPKVGDKIHIPNKEFIEKNLLDQLKETFVDVFKIKLGTHFGQKAKSTKSKKTLGFEQLVEQIKKHTGLIDTKSNKKKTIGATRKKKRK